MGVIDCQDGNAGSSLPQDQPAGNTSGAEQANGAREVSGANGLDGAEGAGPAGPCPADRPAAEQAPVHSNTGAQSSIEGREAAKKPRKKRATRRSVRVPSEYPPFKRDPFDDRSDEEIAREFDEQDKIYPEDLPEGSPERAKLEREEFRLYVTSIIAAYVHLRLVSYHYQAGDDFEEVARECRLWVKEFWVQLHAEWRRESGQSAAPEPSAVPPASPPGGGRKRKAAVPQQPERSRS